MQSLTVENFRSVALILRSPSLRSLQCPKRPKIGATKIRNECLRHEKWPVWGYVGVESAASSCIL